MNKTGTTSIAAFMALHGYSVGHQAQGEMLMKAYARRDWQPILDYCQTADFFQDLPFGAPETAAVLQHHFPQAGFILSVRSSAVEWYGSLTAFHRKVFGRGMRIPTRGDLENAEYRYRGFAWEANRALYPSPAEDPYAEAVLKKVYSDHNRAVVARFAGGNNLLVLNLAETNAMRKLGDFLQIRPKIPEMPWLNKSTDL